MGRAEPRSNTGDDDASLPRPMVIGVAGGVGSGKSAVAQELGALGCLVLDADRQAKAALEVPEVRDELVRWWGSGILDDAERVDRAAVASIVFEDAAQLRRLEGLLHPVVIQEQRDAIANADPGLPGVVLDVPLLFEAGMNAACDAVIFVDTPEADRLARVRASRGWDEAELARRQAKQWPLEQKRAESDVVINNGGDLVELQQQTRAVFERLRSRPRR